MYGGHRGGPRRRNRDDYERREIVESPQEKLKNAILRMGEVDPEEEISRVEDQIRELVPPVISNLSETFHYGVTEQPFKIPFYAALLRRLHEHKGDDDKSVPSIGRQILDDFWKGFQGYLDKLAWRETRLSIHFFAHLTVAGIILPDSMITLLQSFAAVLSEIEVTVRRGKVAARCAAEGLMIAGLVLKSKFAEPIADIIKSIQTYADSMPNARWIVLPLVQLDKFSPTLENGSEFLDMALGALKELDDNNFVEESESYMRPYSTYPELEISLFTIPPVLVPPEAMDMEALDTEAGENVHVKKDEWLEYHLHLFDNDVTPDPATPAGYAIRSVIMSTIDVLEVNRKEGSRLLLEYPRWIYPGTFKSKPGSTVEQIPIPGKDWQLECTIIEIILGCYMVLPESSYKAIYYASLITELCKLRPSTVGPAVGKSIRKLYSSLSDGLDVESSRRFAEWFSIHMSNFSFQWVWKEWIPDLTLDIQHPKRVFIRRALEFEIRLAYFERIAKTLPDEMQAPEALCLPGEPPQPIFEYEESSSPYYDTAQTVLNLLRGRSTPEDVISQIDSIKTSLESSDEALVNVDAIIRSITIQSLLHVGARSFSHFLNAIERYLPVLRNLASGGSSSGNEEAKSHILTLAASFWKYNTQMIGIVFDKFMQYQIVDPTDVVDWTFQRGNTLGQPSGQEILKNVNASQWDLLKGAMDKANGRVLIAQRKITALKKEDDETRAQVKARGGDMDVDGESKPDDTPQLDNPALETALKAFSVLTKEQKSAFSRMLEGFVECLIPTETTVDANPETHTVINEKSWHNRANWESNEWAAWYTWGWYRNFCRVYSPYLTTYAETLSTVSFSRFKESQEPAPVLVRQIWDIAIGQIV